MTLSKVEHALGMMRIYLVESAPAQNDESIDRSEELAQAIAACLRQTTEEPVNADALERDSRLARDVLRRAIRFVNDNLDSQAQMGRDRCCRRHGSVHASAAASSWPPG